MLEMHAVFIGRVQGVGFRAETKFFAEKFHLKGQVRNCPDGTVEIIAQGSKENLEAFLQAIHQTFGKEYIKEAKVDYRLPNKAFESFKISH